MQFDSVRTAIRGRLSRTTNQLQTKSRKLHSALAERITPIKDQASRQSAVLCERLTQLDWARYQFNLRRTLKKWRQDFFYIDGRALAPYLGLLVITAFVFLGNQANSQALAAALQQEGIVSEVEPEVVEQVLRAIDPLTPDITEAPEEVASLLIVADDGGAYLPRPEMTAISEAESLSKKDPIPYVVQKGDTLVSIARAHDRSVATILDANSIKPEDAGKMTPGATLLIPQEDTSHSLAWLEADQRARAEVARKRAEAQAKLAASRRTSGGTVRERATSGYEGTAGGNFIVPISHNGVSRGLGRGHTGIDYRADTGSRVVAAADGRVIEVTRGWAGGWGTSILVDHGGGWTSRYAHLSSNAVGVGETVGQGQVVGYSGNTGRSTGPHLHFEVRVGGQAVQPF